MAWWQKKLLRYALSRTGLLDDKALDPNNLDITLGKKNVVELKDVGLNIKRISKLAQLPTSLRIETARVLSLRLTVPADIYQSSIVAEVDGVELSVKLEERSDASNQEQKSGSRSPVVARIPSHRKVHRRIPSPPPYDPGGAFDSDDEHIPTAEELAKSFLQEEPVRERRELEASVVANAKGLEESIASESSDGDELGTGAAIGLPGFLANFLQGIVDRFQVTIKNVEVNLETDVLGDASLAIPVTLRLHVGGAELASLASNDFDHGSDAQSHSGKRQVKLQDLSVHLLSDAAIFSELSELPSQASPAESRQRERSPETMRTSATGLSPLSPPRPSTASTQRSVGPTKSSDKSQSSPKSVGTMRASILTADDDRFADARDEEMEHSMRSSRGDLDIHPGDDNISWGSRRSKSNAPTEDLWNSMVSEDDMPESLLFQPASRSRTHSSRGDSPNATRTRREPSPYARSLQSPGSWPRLEDSPERNRYYQSPGSWPTMDQSQHSVYQPLTSSPSVPFEESIDNKRNALEASMLNDEDYDTPPEPSENEVEDLAASRMFSHEEAKSMYMSAMTNTNSASMHIPGGWNADDTTSNILPSPDRSHGAPTIPVNEPASAARDQEDDMAYGEQPYSTPGNVTPRAQSPDFPKSQMQSSTDLKKASRQLIYIDTVSVWVPTRENSSQENEPSQNMAASASFTQHNMPGTFSAYSEMSASRRKPANSTRFESSSIVWTPPQSSSPPKSTPAILLEIGNLRCQLDMSCGRLLYRLVTKLSTVLAPSQDLKPEQSQGKAESVTAISVSVLDMRIALKESALEYLNSQQSLEPISSLVTFACGKIDFSTSAAGTALRVASFTTFIGDSSFLSSNRSREMLTSMNITEQTPDVTVTLVERNTVSKRPIWDLSLSTLPLDILLDLRIVDRTFEPFGGLSGILEVGNSILSESGIASSPSSPIKPAKGVRFEGDPQYVETRPEIKVNGYIGGVCATLQGSASSVQLRTSSLHTIYREQGAVVTIEDVVLAGPFSADRHAASLSVDLSTLRLEYFPTPPDKDLERLISLLTPTSDKYDNDDDILIETLIRQRRKGAIFRVTIANVKLNCEDQACISQLTTLGNELGKLSAVAKYLPEDERPGILTMIRLRECEARLPVNERFGKLQITVSDVHCAHVGLPALLALSVGNIEASQHGRVDLVCSVIPPGSENLPMVMARMLGDEVEPTIKVKLLNVCAEYSVPVILDITGLGQEADTEEVVAELAKSVANLLPVSEDDATRRSAPASDSSRSAAKKMNVDLLIHDSAIGLSPQNKSSKALIVLADAHFSMLVPPEEILTARLELRKAGIFVADQFIPDGLNTTVAARGSPNNTATKPRLTQVLSRQGFVSVGSIMSTTILVHAAESGADGTKIVDVDVKNELVLLETCADSTQTLIATLSGLVPPTPPSKQQKYLTEPMTIEDMMASFTGEAFEKPERQPQTLFDVEEEPEDDDMELMLNMADDDGLLSESEMTSSLYGPIGGMLEGVDKIEDDDDAEEFPETVESLLEDDPFEMPSSPTDAKLNDDALRRELNKQSKPAVNDKALDLALYEIADLGFDALGGNQRALSTQYRFNTPSTRRRKDKDLSERDLPFRLKLRDLHVIWNIYDGYDWQRTRDGITQAVERVETKAEERKARHRQSLNEREDEESVIGDFLFNSIYIGVPSNHDAQELRRQINRNIDDLASETESVPLSGISKPTTANSSSGRPIRQRQAKRLRLGRSTSHKIAFELKGVSADVLVFPPESRDVVSSVDVRVKSFEIFDNVPTSTWRKFLTSMSDDPGDREMSRPMVHIEMLNVRTLENFAASEIVMHAAVLPLRLHVDQDALDFITRFFEFKEEGADNSGSASEQPFLQRVEVDTVHLCLDYKPKKVDYSGLRSGHTTEFMNFIILDGANIQLKHAIIYGIKGFEPLHKTLNDIWMPDVQRNQLPTVLAGLAPVRSLVNIGSGLRDVVAVPVREYKKDGRIVRSIQKGAMQFGKTTASELARLGAKVAMGTQTLLQGAEGFLTPTSNSPGRRPSPGRRRSSDHGWHDVDSEDEEHEHRAISAYANQPLGVLSGLRSARKHLEYDLLTARDALIAVQGEILESSGASGAAVAIVKHAPTVILRPVIGTSRAVGTALLGVGNQIDRANLRRIDDKYKRR